MRNVRPWVIGHRGAPGYRPEHTESCYRLAFELGADAVEPDIVASRDGVLVVRHENEISSTTDVADRPEFRERRTTKTVDGARISGWFTEDFTWEELSTLRCRERVPKLRPDNCEYDGAEPMLRLRDVLDILVEEGVRLGRQLGIVIEIKHAHYFRGLGYDLAAILLDELAEGEWDLKPERLVIESFELGVLDRLRDTGAPGSLVFLTERIGSPADEPVGDGPSRSFAWYRRDEGLDLLAERVDGISVAKAHVLKSTLLGRATSTSSLVPRAHERGLLVYTWTLRPENRYLNMRFQSSLRPSEWGDWRGEFELVLSSGLDGIFVDHPDLGVTAINSRRDTPQRD